MEVKVLEIRDRGTFVPAMAIEVLGSGEAQGWLLRRAGFSEEHPLVLLVNLNTNESQYDPFSWKNHRTMGNAHEYVQGHFNGLHDGDVVDVEFVLGESKVPKISERLHGGRGFCWRCNFPVGDDLTPDPHSFCPKCGDANSWLQGAA